jgi:hypothetical protein
MRICDLFEATLYRPSASLTVSWQYPPGGHARTLAGDDVVVWIDPSRFDHDFAQNPHQYVGPNGTNNAIRGRYERFGEWLEEGEPVMMSEVYRDPYGEVSFQNGRHRYAWLRDHGARAMPMLVAAPDAADFQHRYGTTSRSTSIAD